MKYFKGIITTRRHYETHHPTARTKSGRHLRGLPKLLFILLCASASTVAAGTLRATDTRKSDDVERTRNLSVPELRSLAADHDDSFLALERSDLLEEIDANPDLDDRTVEILRGQIKRGFSDFGVYSAESLSSDSGDLNIYDTQRDGDSGDFGIYDPNKDDSIGDNGDLGIYDTNDDPMIGQKGDDPGISPLNGLESIFSTHSFTGNIISSDCGPLACVFPAAYDAKSERVYLVWKVSSFSTMEEFVYKLNGKSLRLYLQGAQLTQGQGVAAPEDFHAYVSSTGCGTNQGEPCLVTVVERDAWFPPTGPWTTWNVRVELFETQQLNPPLLELDQWGNLIYINSAEVKLTQRVATVIPNPNLLSFWTSTIGASVLSERCTTCHTMDTPVKIADRHGGLVSAGSVGTIPSLLVPGESVLHCSNCHEAQLSYLGTGSSFPENVWATPTPQLDINWAQIVQDHPMTWPTEICNRMVTKLSTHALREQHFHEDARLFWAVEKGELPIGYPDLATAAPHIYSQFVSRFDTWNDSGAPCP